jgi:hypoxia up-regulated 1
MAPRSFARWLLALAALFCVASTASAAVLGIDYGSEYVKVSIVAPGRTPISIVINEISKRKSTAAVAFTGGDRWLAEEAMNYNARFPDRVFTRLRDLLGKETAVDSFTRYLDKYKLPFKVTADAERATARIVTESGEAYLVEELVAMILQYAMKIGEGMGKGQIKVRRSRPLSATGTPRATSRGDRTKRRKRAIERPSFVDVLFRTRRACHT